MSEQLDHVKITTVGLHAKHEISALLLNTEFKS